MRVRVDCLRLQGGSYGIDEPAQLRLIDPSGRPACCWWLVPEDRDRDVAAVPSRVAVLDVIPEGACS
jgi:hypothetical protein